MTTKKTTTTVETRRRATQRLANGATFETLTHEERAALQGDTRKTTKVQRARTTASANAIAATLIPSGPRVGRPSLFTDKSTGITFRCSATLRKRLEDRARSLGCSLSDAVAVVLERGLAVADANQ